MQITWERITFPFREEKWLGNMAIGALFGLIGLIFFPAYILFAGQMARLMKQTIRGEEPTLTKWDDFGEIIIEGLKLVVVGFVYYLPLMLLMCVMYGLFFALIPVFALIGESDAAAAGSFIVIFGVYGLSFLLMGVMLLLTFVLSYLMMVGITRMVANDSLSSAFEFREVWELTKAGFKNFIIAFLVGYALYMGAGMIVMITFYTVILACLFPFLIGAAYYFGALQFGALFGSAYRQTMLDMDRPVESPVSPAE
jgi:hypothetical protein